MSNKTRVRKATRQRIRRVKASKSAVAARAAGWYRKNQGMGLADSLKAGWAWVKQNYSKG